MVDYETELQRIRGILNNMSPREFDNMLEECGINKIKPSREAIYFSCMIGLMEKCF